MLDNHKSAKGPFEVPVRTICMAVSSPHKNKWVFELRLTGSHHFQQFVPIVHLHGLISFYPSSLTFRLVIFTCSIEVVMRLLTLNQETNQLGRFLINFNLGEYLHLSPKICFVMMIC